MRPFNPFIQKRKKTVEVILKPCPDCNGMGFIKEEGEEGNEEKTICLKCGRSGEITENKIINQKIRGR